MPVHARRNLPQLPEWSDQRLLIRFRTVDEAEKNAMARPLHPGVLDRLDQLAIGARQRGRAGRAQEPTEPGADRADLCYRNYRDTS